MSEVGREFAMELKGRENDSNFQARLGSLAPILHRFGETLEEIQNYREALLISLETTFSEPMETFVKREVKEVKKKRVEMSGSLEEVSIGRASEGGREATTKALCRPSYKTNNLPLVASSPRLSTSPTLQRCSSSRTTLTHR